MNNIDTLIFVGFDNPHDDPEHGDRTLTRIMNATGVEKDNIYFYSIEHSSPMEIVRGSFIMDKTQPHNYRIGDALCVASDSLKTKRKEVEKLGRIGITVHTGYQHVDLSSLSESEIINWVESGRYVPDVESGSSDDDSSTDDLLSDILGDLSEVEASQSQAAPVSEKQEDDEDDEDDQDDEDSQETSSVLDDIDALDDQVNSHKESQSYEQNEDSEKEYEKPEDSSDAQDEEVIYDAELVPTEEETLTGSYKDEPKQELDDILSGLDNPSSASPASYEEKEEYSGISPEQMGVEDPQSSQASHSDDYSSTFYHNDKKDSSSEDLRDPEEYRKEKGIDESSPMEEDSMEIITQMSNRRKESIRDKEKMRQRESGDGKEEDNSPLSQLEAIVGSKKRAREMDKDDREAHKLDVQSRSRSEETMREDGKRKNYHDYLTDRGRTEQKVEENIRSQFGNTEEYSGGVVHSEGAVYSESGEDNEYVTKGVGRIILCTAGKGGVGKTLVSIGMASSLSLARAYEAKENPGYTPGRTWLIESDYNSPKLAAAYGTGKKHIGNLAYLLDNSPRASLGNEEVRQCIEDNIYRDSETGVNVLACPPLSMNATSTSIPMAILMAITYASRQGDDVIVDHGNLTVGEYSSLDKILAKKTAHRVVVVGNMGCIDQTRTALDVLASSVPGSSEKPRNPHSISVVLNKSRSEQYYKAQDKLKPFRIIAIIPPIDALREENSVTGDTYLNNAPQEVKKAIYDRCGIMLTRLGFSSLQNFFVAKTSYTHTPKRGRKNIFRRLSERIAGDNR